LRRIKMKCYAWPNNNVISMSHLLEQNEVPGGLSATNRVDGLWFPFSRPVWFARRLIIMLARSPCLLAAADQTAPLRSFEEARSSGAQSTVFAATKAGTWRLVRTPNPRGGPDAVSIMETADTARSDMTSSG